VWIWIRRQEVAATRTRGEVLPQTPFVIHREGKRLVIRLVSGVDKILLLREEQPATMAPAFTAPLSLSPREAQVLNWLSQGKTNKEIGRILELSARTVQKHLEHIYRKLGVETRTAAAARMYELHS
jgi:DNA-binding CsgD family transcriptional regulator